MSCEKTTYDTFYEAQKTLSGFNSGRQYKNRRLAHKIPKRVYKCEKCGKYHLTSMKQKQNK